MPDAAPALSDPIDTRLTESNLCSIVVDNILDNADQKVGETPAGPASGQTVRLLLDHDPPLDRTEAPEVLHAWWADRTGPAFTTRHRAGIDPPRTSQFSALAPITESGSRFVGRLHRGRAPHDRRRVKAVHRGRLLDPANRELL